jgi:hypothetical protein
MTKRSKKPADLNRLAAAIVDEATKAETKKKSGDREMSTERGRKIRQSSR